MPVSTKVIIQLLGEDKASQVIRQAQQALGGLKGTATSVGTATGRISGMMEKQQGITARIRDILTQSHSMFTGMAFLRAGQKLIRTIGEEMTRRPLQLAEEETERSLRAWERYLRKWERAQKRAEDAIRHRWGLIVVENQLYEKTNNLLAERARLQTGLMLNQKNQFDILNEAAQIMSRQRDAIQERKKVELEMLANRERYEQVWKEYSAYEPGGEIQRRVYKRMQALQSEWAIVAQQGFGMEGWVDKTKAGILRMIYRSVGADPEQALAFLKREKEYYERLWEDLPEKQEEVKDRLTQIEREYEKLILQLENLKKIERETMELGRDEQQFFAWKKFLEYSQQIQKTWEQIVRAINQTPDIEPIFAGSKQYEMLAMGPKIGMLPSAAGVQQNMFVTRFEDFSKRIIAEFRDLMQLIREKMMVE